MDAYVIEAFISRTTIESLIHELGHNKLRTTRELLDLVTSHASGEEAVQANLRRNKGKTLDEPGTVTGEERAGRIGNAMMANSSWRSVKSTSIKLVGKALSTLRS
jgi:hypothetical protein